MLDKIIVKGGSILKGAVRIEGAKNSVLPIITASLMASEGKSVLSDVPTLDDVYTINEVLRNLNAEVTFENKQVTINAAKKLETEDPFEFVSKMRSLALVFGILQSRYGHAIVYMYSGCGISSRAIDFHLKGFEAM